ncbi:hypothetical protein [Mycobacteroides abscessus]|uniref:hypothetical protein n=1 Tax=Mycobacteroides abscessus TaxID=36809 RepID=UPI00266BAC1C|nr:hypothetical protein [Mycobacteroides abscessus]MDO3140585.1 hypothetical protein [Mycobacteroides abscessus subsp. abscessus]
MDHQPPRPAGAAAPAQWLIDRVDLWDHQHWPTGMVGAGFGAYARLLHPLDDHPGPLTWATVARANSRILHPSVWWEKIKSSASSGRGRPGDPMRGDLNGWALKALCAILARHTTTAQACCFAVWEGWGWLHDHDSPASTITAYYAPDGVIPDIQPPQPAPAQWRLATSGPTFSLPGRRYHLFKGHIDAAVRIGHWVNEDFFIPQSPSFFWPADHTWCVATEVDYDSTIIGGTRELIDQLRTSEMIEVLQIPPDAPYEDRLNA